MTEAEWLTCTDPKVMLYRRPIKNPSHRKLTLFACGCCRRIWHLLADARRQKVVEVTERVVDGELGIDELTECYRPLFEDREVVSLSPSDRAIMEAGNVFYVKTVSSAIMSTDFTACYCSAASNNPYEQAVQASLLLDILGNPFRPVTIDPRWLTSTVVDLASAIYTEKAFDRMPILGDALTDAGCDNEEIINHCRGDGPHVRGCFVIDLLLGKA